MEKRIGWAVRLVAIILGGFMLVGCKNDKENPEVQKEAIKGVELERGAVIRTYDNNMINENLKEGKYLPVTYDGIIIFYDIDSNRYIYSKEGKHYIFFDGKENLIEEKNYKNMKLSPKGKYFSMFRVVDNINELAVLDVEKNRVIDIDSDVIISGELLDWINEDTLVYYGVSNEGVNGVYSFNVKEKKEELLYKLDEGIVQFLKCSEDGVIFIQINNDNGKELKRLNYKTKEVEYISNKIVKIEDVVSRNGEIFILGKFENDVFSLYKIEENKATRLVYDFPQVVKEDRKLSIDEEGNILFVGVEKEAGLEEVYKYTTDGSISLVGRSSKEYIFVEN